MRLEVRCCCSPKKLVGWMELQDGISLQHPIGFPIRDQANRRYKIGEWDRLYLTPAKISFSEMSRAGSVVTESYLALKAEGIPVEKLRLIRGFEDSRKHHEFR